MCVLIAGGAAGVSGAGVKVCCGNNRSESSDSVAEFALASLAMASI